LVAKTKYVRWFEDVDSKGVAEVGGKNASLGEMIRNLKDKDIKVPDGFATTASAYYAFLDKKDGWRKKVKSLLDELESNRKPVHEVGDAIRELLIDAEFPAEVAEAIRGSYHELCCQYDANKMAVAVRSSANHDRLWRGYL